MLAFLHYRRARVRVRGTSRDDGLQLGAVDEGPLDGLGLDVGPVDALLLGVVVHHRHVVDVRHRQRRHHVHVGVVDVHAADLRAPHVQQELLQRWGPANGKRKVVKQKKYNMAALAPAALAWAMASQIMSLAK